MLGPPDTALLHVCGPPRPGVANRPSSSACCVGLGQGQRGAHRHALFDECVMEGPAIRALIAAAVPWLAGRGLVRLVR